MTDAQAKKLDLILTRRINTVFVQRQRSRGPRGGSRWRWVSNHAIDPDSKTVWVRVRTFRTLEDAIDWADWAGYFIDWPIIPRGKHKRTKTVSIWHRDLLAEDDFFCDQFGVCEL